MNSSKEIISCDSLEYQLLLACSNGNIDQVKELKDEQININSVFGDPLYGAPIIMACRKNHFEIVDLLLNDTY